jgi:hypothetical protein
MMVAAFCMGVGCGGDVGTAPDPNHPDTGDTGDTGDTSDTGESDAARPDVDPFNPDTGSDTGQDGGEDVGQDTVVVPPEDGCERIDSLLDDARACRLDEHCPCGAYCDLGRCVSQCTTDNDCTDGQTCSDFGRCLAPDSLERAVVVDQRGVVEARPSLLPVLGDGDSVRIDLRVSQGTVNRIRLVASEGLNILCEEGATPVSECMIETDIAAGETRSVEVLGTGAPVDGRFLTLYSAGHVQTLSVRTVAQATPPEPPAVVAPGGRFTGSLQLLEEGLTGESLMASSVPQVTPLSAEVYLAPGASQGVIVLIDHFGRLHPQGRWVGQLNLSNQGDTLEMPSFMLHEGSIEPGIRTRIMRSGSVSGLEFVDGGAAVYFDLTAFDEGALLDGKGTVSTYRIVLTRQSDLAPNAVAPTVPNDVSVSVTWEQMTTLLPWEQRVESALSSVFGLSHPQQAFVESMGGRGDGHLRFCGGGGPFSERSQLQTAMPVWMGDWFDTLQPTVRTWNQWRNMPGHMYQEVASFLLSIEAGNPFNPSTGFPLDPNDSTALQMGIFNVLGFNWPWHDVPCEFDMGAANLQIDYRPCGLMVSHPFAARSIDQCAAVAEALGCEVTDDVLMASMQTDIRINVDEACSPEGVLRSPLSIKKVCRMPYLPPMCPDTILCNGSGVRTPASPLTGEFPCGDEGYGAAIGADIRAAAAAVSGVPVKSDALLETCIADLDRLFGGADTTTELASLLAPGSCLNAPRFLSALGMASKVVYSTLPPDPAIPEEVFGRSPRSEGHTHRLMQRWLLVHAFLAREATQREQLARDFRLDGNSSNVPLLPLDEVLTTSLRGWDLFFHPRFAMAIEMMSPEVLLRPDWRVSVDPQVTTLPHHEHGVGLPVTMIETLERQLALAEEHLAHASYISNRRAIEDVQALLSITDTIRAIAVGLYGRARAAASNEGMNEVPWGARFERELANLGNTYDRVINQANLLRDGANPLGIEDSDLPLYFFGDAADPGSRFAAISDFFLGRVGTSNVGWAEQLVTAAEVSYTAARNRWAALREREWQAALNTATQQERETNLRLRYGDQINELCGLDTDSYDVLDLDEISPNTCFINESAPACRPSVASFAQTATIDDLALHICMVNEFQSQGLDTIRFVDAGMDAISRRVNDCLPLTYEPNCGLHADGAGCLRCVIPGQTPTTLQARISLENLQIQQPRGASPDVHTATMRCENRHPRGRGTIPVGRRLEEPGCLRGAMGETALTILAATRDVEIARAEFDERMDAYDIAMRSCAILQSSSEAIRTTTELHNSTMRDFRAGKAVADTVAQVASGVKDCTNSLASASGDAVFSFGVSVGLAAAACVAGGIEVAANIVSLGLETEMNNAEASHGAAIDSLERTADIDRCKIEAEMELVGLRAASLRIARAMDDLNLINYILDEQKGSVAGTFEEGKNSLARLQGRAVSPVDGDLWLDEEVENFKAQMRIAKRMTYLTVRAVEYEFQQSLAARSDVLRAARPAQLMSVITRLRTDAAARGINGNRPSELKVVLSLREHLMQLHDRTSAPDGEHQLSEVERFRNRLMSEQFKAYDDQGQFIGLNIPFELAPLDALGLGNSAGIGIFSQNDCAERLWSANASVVGSDNVMRGGSTFTRMDLLKRNTFYSQWCGSPPAGAEPFQVASVRPSRNLFRDPQYGTEVASSLLGLVSRTELYSRARMQPRINVSRVQFEDDAYANGQTSELAARGLYGDYALFIPANMLSRIVNGTRTNGLDLNEVEDIFVRLDYISVAR